MVEVSVSILSVQQENAIRTFYNLEEAKVNYFHIDVMDGKFVEQDTSSIMREYTEYLKQITNVPLDVHLMVEDVEAYIQSYSAMEPNSITFHLESAKNKEDVLKWIHLIRDFGIKVGISIKPNTKVEEIIPYLPYINVCLVMSVEPGYGGQTFQEEAISKIEELKEYRDREQLDFLIEVDGGIDEETVNLVKKAGCDIVVAGTYILQAKDKKEAVAILKKE